ncbi:hypothetical protein D3C85_1674160 [compost metagenome]
MAALAPRLQPLAKPRLAWLRKTLSFGSAPNVVSRASVLPSLESLSTTSTSIASCKAARTAGIRPGPAL